MSDTDIVSLSCKCGAAATLTNTDAYHAGWRVDNKRGQWQHICPACMEKRDTKHYRESVRRYGKEATDRGRQICRDKHGF